MVLEKMNERVPQYRIPKTSDVQEQTNQKESTFKDDLEREKARLVKKVDTLESDLKQAREDEADAKKRQLEVANNAEALAKKLKAIELMESTFD